MRSYRPATVIAIVLGSFAALIGIALAVLVPIDNGVRSLGKQIDQQQVTSALNALQQRQATSSQRLFDRFQAATTTIDQMFLTETNALDFVTAIEHTAARHNVTESMSGLKAPAAPGQQVPLQLSLIGNYRNLRNTVADLQRLPYFFIISGMTWAQVPAGATSGASAQLILIATVAWK